MKRNFKIVTSQEQERGCGFRKEGGIYAVTENYNIVCGKLPILARCCVECGEGIKPSRAGKWIGKKIFDAQQCRIKDCLIPCVPFDGSIKKFYLLWIGGSYYKTKGKFANEAQELGISRRLTQGVPRDFKVGQSWIALAHRQGIIYQGEPAPAIFYVFKPDRIEYILKGDETEKQLKALTKRGLTLIELVKIKNIQTKL